MTKWALTAAGATVALGVAFSPALAQYETQPGSAQPGAAQQAVGEALLQVAESDQYGSYLADSQGRALYMFTADSEGTSNCTDACAEAWPPLLAEGQPTVGDQVDQSLLDTIQRPDGSTQVTYNGMPLYYFARDQAPGDVTGQDVEGFGGGWYLVTPEGEQVEAAG